MPRLPRARASLACIALLPVLALATLSIAAPQAAQLPSPASNRPMAGNDRADDDPFRSSPDLRERLERSRASDRQRRMVDDANRLVALTTQYHQAIAAHGKPTEDDVKLLAQIEKLARDLKDRMRGM